jgi:hypothetical protein
MKSTRRSAQIAKEFGSREGVRGGQTLYMTGRMRKNVKKRAPNQRAVLHRAQLDGSY